MKERNIKLFYVHELFFQFSDSMLIIILPIFLYKLFGTISAVFLFIFIWNVIYSIIFIPIFNLSMKLKNPKYFMAMGMVFYIISLGLFGQITPENIKLIIPATLFFVLYISFYWMIRHWFFSVNSDYLKIGKQISTLTIIKIIIGFIAPITGGIISFVISFNAAFILGACAGALSLIPILLFHAPAHSAEYSFKNVKNILQKPELKTIRFTYICEAFASILVHNVWTLIFIIFIGNVMNFGFLVGFTTLIASMLAWMTGRWFDQKKRKMVLIRLSIIRTVCVLLYTTLFFYAHIFWVTAVELINKLTFNMHLTAGDSYLYAYGNKVHPIDFNLNREIHLNIGRLLSSGTMAVLFYFLPVDYLWIVIAIGAFSILGFIKLTKIDHLLH